MHKMFLIVFVTLCPALAGAQTLTRDLEVSAWTRAAKVNLEAACVSYVNSEGEASAVTLFYSRASYPEAQRLLKAGYPDTDLLGAECGRDLAYVQVNQYAKSEEVQAEIQRAGGFKPVWLAFYNAAEAQKNFWQSLRKALRKL